LQIQALNYVEEECEIVKQQEKTLKSEITLLRSKLANCETELLQCKNKIRLVMDELQLEQRALSRRNESRRQMEKSLMAEMERLQRDIELAKQSTELHHLTAETLKKEVAALETAIIEKKKQVELLVAEMKEANLESLTIAPPEDLRTILEGPNKSGSTRKMIGSPRQLENAVPTNKNPHGVWV
jgi:Ras association domain-containing protein 7/8